MMADSRLVRRMVAFAVVLAVVVAPTVVVEAAGAAGGRLSVSLFYDRAYVDTSQDGGGEAFNLRRTLEGLGAQVRTFDGLETPDWTAALNGADVVAIPELTNVDLGFDMQAGARRALAKWVDAGGRLIVIGGSDPWSTVNVTFGFNVLSNFEDTLCVDRSALSRAHGPAGPPGGCVKTPAAKRTEFAAGPDMLVYNDDTSTPGTPLPDGSTVVYRDVETGRGGVSVTPFGHGSILFLGWDWFFETLEALEAAQLGAGQDAGWIDVLGLGINVSTSVSDAAAAEGMDARFAVTLNTRVSQDIVVDYETIDRTARAGVDYVATKGSVVIPAGQSSAVVRVPTLEGGTGTRSFTLAVTDPYFGFEADGEGTGTITGESSVLLPASARGVAVTPRFTG